MHRQGVEVSVVYADDDLLEVCVSASIGVFAGRAECYTTVPTLAELASLLQGFPQHSTDFRDFALGTFDRDGAGGGASFRFYCRDSAGHAAVEVHLQSAPDRYGDAVSLHIASAVDSFVRQMGSLSAEKRQSARLDSAG